MQINETALDPAIQTVITSLYREASTDKTRRIRGAAKAVFRRLEPSDMKSVYMPISQVQGEFLYQTILEHGCKTIIEFGTSFGISTLFLGAAAQKTGGQIITTEIIASKAEQAQKNFDKAGLTDIIELRVGDAMETLKHIPRPIDLLLLDGWKNLYLPLFKQLEPSFRKGTLIYADNIDMPDSQPYHDYILAHSAQYTSQTMHQGKAAFTRQL